MTTLKSKIKLDSNQVSFMFLIVGVFIALAVGIYVGIQFYDANTALASYYVSTVSQSSSLVFKMYRNAVLQAIVGGLGFFTAIFAMWFDLTTTLFN